MCVCVWPTWDTKEWLRGNSKGYEVVHDNLRSVAGVVALVEGKDGEQKGKEQKCRVSNGGWIRLGAPWGWGEKA